MTASPDPRLAALRAAVANPGPREWLCSKCARIVSETCEGKCGCGYYTAKPKSKYAHVPADDLAWLLDALRSADDRLAAAEGEIAAVRLEIEGPDDAGMTLVDIGAALACERDALAARLAGATYPESGRNLLRLVLPSLDAGKLVPGAGGSACGAERYRLELAGWEIQALKDAIRHAAPSEAGGEGRGTV